MSDSLANDSVDQLRRPRLLVRAARFGLAEYNRDRDLRRIFKDQKTPSPARAVPRLLEAEADLEATRQSGEATYSVARHVMVLVALISEQRLLPKAPALRAVT